MSKIPIDMQFLLVAWQDDSPDHLYYLNKETGQVELVSRDFYDLDDLTDDIERARESYLYVPKPDPKELKDDLKDFVASYDEAATKRLLEVALEAPNALHALKSVLKTSEAQGKLDSYLESCIKGRVEKWLQANFIAY